MQEIENQTNCITVLDEHTANRIAAGEVIERPASVVKELVENAIDAGATQIRVDVEDGGKELIKISDNGHGMTREDVVVSIQRHATSKIRSAEDLFAIRTLGFRGEGLPSIASVSMMEIVTKNETDSAGTRMEIQAGTITNLESVGAPLGTTMSVNRVFFNTPARLKFLRSAQTEISHIIDLVGRFALSYPKIGFRLTHGGRELLSVAGTGDVLGATAAVFGRDTAKQLIKVDYETPVMHVWGYVSNPSYTRANRSQQVFFVNRRSIKSRTITHAADFAYREFVQQPGRFPTMVLFVDIDPELVDVNVHPTKSEVKFSSDQEVHSAVHKAVKNALLGGGAIQTITETRQITQPAPNAENIGQGVLLTPEQSNLATFGSSVLDRNQSVPLQIDSSDPFDWRSAVQSQGIQSEQPVSVENAASVRLKNVKVIGQVRNTYIVAECEDGILIIDQHVAHERILYEALKKNREEGQAVMQGLVIPITLELSRREGLVVSERLDDLKSIGFDVEPFGSDTFILRAVPADAKAKHAEPLLRDIIAELVDVSVTKHLLARPEQVIITTSCKLAVKAGDPLTMPEMENLIKQLIVTDNPFVCPHGRPIIISLPHWDLDRKFKRPTV